MSIVLSHNTAKAVYQAARSVSTKDIESCSPVAIYGSCPTGTLLGAAAEWLTKHDVARDASESLEVVVFDRRNARYAMDCRCHVSSKRFSCSRFMELEDNIYIVGVELCALQAATYLPFRELVEYYFELCGAYSLGTGSSSSYTERFPLTSTERLKQFFNSVTRCDGLALARKAIQCVRDGCRSPMETAFVMMLTLPKSEGGLGIKGIETDYEVKVTAAAKNLTRRKKFFMDAYLKRSRTDIEYNGFYHDAEENRAIDEERKNALASMGYGIITVSRYSFMHASPFVRVMEAIQRKEGIRPSRLPKDFQIMQEDLRLFVLRRFIEEKKRIQEELRQEAEEGQRIGLEKAMLEGITLDDPTINEAPAIDDMQTVEPDSPLFDQTSSLTPEGRVFGTGNQAS
ncbi:hypothetical protein [Collinsella sp. TM06-3]|uniref:hypothetical protein n=1 Tax=Collinsella sp. TM06-3 TaxID=2292342 RepID=UPI0011C19406|nr:hypothetical protein [Collinsella sp. TM06-3]